MPLHPKIADIVLRLALSFIAGAVVGLNREERRASAGLRTTILVCLAAAISMVQANLLLEAAGKAPDSFVVLDLMRLPLGILSGMGFIGAGAIIRRKTLVRGVTTAATLWFTTVMGLCFGGGQIALGLSSLGLAMVVLWALKWLEKAFAADRRAMFFVEVEGDNPDETAISDILRMAGMEVEACGVTRSGARRTFTWSVSWREKGSGCTLPPAVWEIERNNRVTAMEWRPMGSDIEPSLSRQH